MPDAKKGQVSADSQSAVKVADKAMEDHTVPDAVNASNALTPTLLQSHADLKLHLARSDGQTKAPQERESEAAMVERLDTLAKPHETELPTDAVVAQSGHPDGTIATGALEKGHELLEKLRDPETREAYRRDGVTGQRVAGSARGKGGES
jgi:hypothetical protein